MKEEISKLIKNKYFSGIGSRKTPPDICYLMNEISKKLELGNWILRSGRANGADKAFEGINFENLKFKNLIKNKNIYTIKNFHQNNKENIERCKKELISVLDPELKYEKLSAITKILFLRNINQIIGDFPFDNFSKFVICWTPHVNYHEFSCGGTRIAIRLAQKYSIPVFNLVTEKDKKRIIKWLK